MFEKRDVARLIEQIEAERVGLTQKGVELKKQLEKITDELTACDARAKQLATLVEQLAHYHDGTTPDRIPF